MEKYMKYKGVTIEKLDEPHYKVGYNFIKYWWKVDVEVSVNIGGNTITGSVPKYFQTLQETKNWINDLARKRITDVNLY